MTSGTAGGNAGDAVRKGVGMFHGAGEAIRGNINAFVDKATGDQESAARHEVIASRGVDEMKNGYQSRTTAGAATTNRNTGKKATSRSGSESRGSTSSNYGPHSTNLGKKLDSFVDSDHGHRSAPSNYGPHSTNPGNKLNPRYDSDCDHCGAHGGNIGTEPHIRATHRSNNLNGLDPRIDIKHGTRRFWRAR
ncbi:hypothetical protein P154DRAFT_421429 [Amniculicola lignicola CBS 123094]|uniref:Uncharacterized protein n=1 Tax=Amniculicola lignicola CBS 123094 TaxID=1392246 RepID=A0A6A5X2D8_9PLEO|nr:hypothetical protein P154DRAFT_421429 [Amniculicola lignicola CBS 123094]